MLKITWNRYFLGMALITSIALVIWIAGASAVAQSSLSGEWTATVSSKDSSKIQLNMERRSEKSGRHQMGQSFEFSDFQGLRFGAIVFRHGVLLSEGRPNIEAGNYLIFG